MITYLILSIVVSILFCKSSVVFFILYFCVFRHGETVVGLPDRFNPIRLCQSSIRPTFPSERFVQLWGRQLQALAQTGNSGKENCQLTHHCRLARERFPCAVTIVTETWNQSSCSQIFSLENSSISILISFLVSLAAKVRWVGLTSRGRPNSGNYVFNTHSLWELSPSTTKRKIAFSFSCKSIIVL